MVAAAEAAGTRVPVEPVVREATTELLSRSGRLRGTPHKPAARSTLRRFAEDVATERLMTPAEIAAAVRAGVKPSGTISELLPLKPTEIDQLLRNMIFQSGAPHLPGATTATRALRKRLSGEFKRTVPGVAPVLAEQSRLIPMQRVVDEALALGRGLGPKAPAIYVSGGRPRLFSVIAPTAGTSYAAGKLLSRAGGPLGASPLAQRVLPGSTRSLLNLLLQQEGFGAE